MSFPNKNERNFCKINLIINIIIQIGFLILFLNIKHIEN